MYVQTTEIQISLPLAEVELHKIATVGQTAGSLGSFISGGIPSWTNVAGSTEDNVYPAKVYLELSPANDTALVRVTLDGNTTADVTSGAEKGLTLPLMIACSDLLKMDSERGISIVSDTADTVVLCSFFIGAGE